MEKLTYKQAYDKIIQAYFRDEIKPMDMNFCFCGTLSDGIDRCGTKYRWISSNYSREDFLDMEYALMIKLEAVGNKGDWNMYSHRPNEEDYEDRLFAGMCAALEVLKQIHKERGEDVDGVPEFTKRELKKQDVCV